MPSFDVIKSTIVPKTFRAESVRGKFDFQQPVSEEHFRGELPIDGWNWNVGCIYGHSGSGKTSIAHAVFPPDAFIKRDYSHDCVLDDFSQELSVDEITRALTSSGFASPPCWLRPYRVLSQGEQMRVDVARCILSPQPMTVYDEFTSTVDRPIAQIASLSIQKTIRKCNKQFVAVTCHSDVLDWLQPDWTLCTDDMQFKKKRSGTAPPSPLKSSPVNARIGTVIGGFII